jgi:hypothetical protein
MRCEFLAAVSAVFCDVTPCNFIDGYQPLGNLSAPFSENFSSLKMEASGSYETLVSSTKLHGVTYKEIAIRYYVRFELHLTRRLQLYNLRILLQVAPAMRISNLIRVYNRATGDNTVRNLFIWIGF